MQDLILRPNRRSDVPQVPPHHGWLDSLISPQVLTHCQTDSEPLYQCMSASSSCVVARYLVCRWYCLKPGCEHASEAIATKSRGEVFLRCENHTQGAIQFFAGKNHEKRSSSLLKTIKSNKLFTFCLHSSVKTKIFTIFNDQNFTLNNRVYQSTQL